MLHPLLTKWQSLFLYFSVQFFTILRCSISFFRPTDAVDNGNFHVHSASLADQATLKIDRELLPNDEGNNSDERIGLLGYNQASATDSESISLRPGSDGLHADIDLSMTNSQQSLSQVSQLTPEVESLNDLELSELLANV